jgi:DNA-binding beta-propeller fold protein YncE
MAARGRNRTVLALLAVAALGGLVGGCGTTFKLPTEIRGTSSIAGQSTYMKVGIWRGLTNIQDILLTPGGELFMVFQDPATKTGEVRQYPQASNVALATNFPGLRNPTAICSGANRIFVLDQGDSSAARSNASSYYMAEANADVDSNPAPLGGFTRPITNLSAYWRVREYLLDGTPVSSFTDTTFAWVSGIAADAQGRVYVSGVIMFCNLDPYESARRTLEYRFRVRRYVPGTGDRYVVTDVGPTWRRDPTYVLLQGTGIGSAMDPRGMQCAAPQGAALYFADFGNNQVQRYGDPVSGASSFKLVFGGLGAEHKQLAQPLDVAVDSAGFIYMVDAGNLRVLRYGPDGAFVQRVDWNVGEVEEPLVLPVAVAADNRQVYIANRGTGEVLRYRRRD